MTQSGRTIPSYPWKLDVSLILKLTLLILSVALFAPATEAYWIFALGSFLLICLTFRKSLEQRPFFWLGIVTPLAPFFGPGALLVAALSVVIFSRKALLLSNRWAWPWIIALILNALPLVLPYGGFVGAISNPHTGFEWIAAARSEMIPYGLPLCERILLWYVFISLVSILAESEGPRRAFRNGLVGGAFSAFVIVIFEGLAILPTSLFPTHSAFWTMVGRVGGTFSDPNACGVFCLLILFIAIASCADSVRIFARALWVALGLLCCLTAAYAGSRTFFLGFSALVFVALWSRSRRVVTYSLIATAVVIAVLVAVESSSNVSGYLGEVGCPVGLIRVVRAFDIARVEENFLNRVIFYYAAYAMWQSSPVFGLGFGTFQNWLPAYSEGLKLGLESWTDNANNFYLGTLAELGFFGMWSLYLSASALRPRAVLKNSEQFFRYGLGAFALTLLVGPHLDFPEISVVAAYFVAVVFVPGPGLQRERIAYWVLLPAVAGSALGLTSREIGTYLPEKGPGGWSRWTTEDAVIELPCSCAGEAKLDYIVHHANPDPVSVHINTSEGQNLTSVFNRPEHKTVVLACPNRLETGAGGEPRRIRVRVRTEPTWRPVDRGQGPDSRNLGIQIEGLRGIPGAGQCF